MTGAAPVKGSVVWRYFGDARNMLLAPTTLVLQVAHPVVGAGVLEHSNYRDKPWGRLIRTYMSLATIIYGGDSGAGAESARLRELHRDVKGVDGLGRRYHALHPEAYTWVHATLVQGGVDGHRIFGRPLTGEQLETYYRQMRDVGLLLGLREHHLPVDWAAFRTYYDERVANRLEDNQAVWDVLDTTQHPKKPFRYFPGPLWRPIARVAGRQTRMLTIGTLPVPVRERLGLPWTERDERRLRRFATLVRWTMTPVLPRMRIAGALAAASLARRRGIPAPRRPVD